MDFETRYKKLNDAQRQAVDTIDGPVMVVAGPGTGKTELLSMRAANILKKTDTLPENILCLTFTDSGAAAMRERLVSIIGKDAYKVAIHTFHSFGAEVINQNGDFFYQGAHFRAADALSSYEILHTIFDGLEYSNPLASKMNGEYTHLGDTLSVISELKKSGLTSDELLLVLDANDSVIDTAEPLLASIFAIRIGKKTTDELRLTLPLIRSSGGAVELPDIPPLSQVLADSLERAINDAEETNSTKPITAWRNAWMKKNDQGEFILKTRDRQAKLRAVSYIYYQYLSRMQESELYDFDDMILRVVHALEVFPELRFNLQEKYQYIMVDEFQDTNMAQARILHSLTHNDIVGDRPNILVVGDDDQAIYSFQGAEVSNILHFRTEYPQTQLITLTDNYRSSEQILERARSVIVQGSERLENTIEELDKELTAHHTPTNGEVKLYALPTAADERHFIATRIKQQIESGVAPESIAVLARRHHELMHLLPYLARVGVSANYERRDNVLDLEPVALIEKVAAVVVALYENRHDEAGGLLPELLAHPAWGIAPLDLWKLSLAAYQKRHSWLEEMETRPEFTTLHSWLIELVQQVAYVPLERILDTIMGHEDSLLEDEPTAETDDPFGVEDTPASSFISPLFEYFFSKEKLADRPDEYLTFLEGLRTIRARLRDYHPEEKATLQTFLSFIDLHRQLGTSISSIRPSASATSGAINLMTAHKAKGLEFDSVYILDAIDSMWGEKSRSRARLISYPENLPIAPLGENSDERLRLFFVAMTRAKANLYISYANVDDNGKETLLANFLSGNDWTPESIQSDTSPAQALEIAENQWYENVVTVAPTDMKQLLAPSLETYKLSATHLNNFLDVTRGGPTSFLLQNILRFPQAMSPAAAYGSAIHQTLQRAHMHLAATGELRPIEDVLHDFETNLSESHLEEDDLTSFLQQGTETLQTFLAAKYDSFTPRQKVELNFAGQAVFLGEAHLTGSLDLVDIDTEARTIRVTDYKTGKPSQSWQGKTEYEKIKLHKYRQQLMFYQLLINHSRDYANYHVEGGTLQFVEPTMRGDIVALEASFTAEELADFSKLIQIVWHKIITLDLPDVSTYDQTLKGMLAFEHDLLDITP